MSDIDKLAVQFRLNLIAIRTAGGLSQSELARKMHRQPSFVCDLEAGRRRPSMSTLSLLATALGVDPSALISSKPEKNLAISA